MASRAAPTGAAGHDFVSVLESTALFSGFGRDLISTLAGRCRARVARPGEVIFSEDDPALELYILVQGLIVCYRSSADGREQGVKLYQNRGDVFPLIAVCGPGEHVVSARALSPTRLCVSDLAVVRGLARHTSALSLRLASLVASEEADVIALVADLALRNATARLARILAVLACREADELRSGMELDRRYIAAEQLATMIGAVRVHASRCLQSLVRRGAVRLSRRSIMIRDADILTRIAEEEVEERGRAAAAWRGHRPPDHRRARAMPGANAVGRA